MKEALRDKTRDELAWNLANFAGVKAHMSDRGRQEEKMENSWYQRSLGVIDIADGPIKWINILKKDRSQKSPAKWWIVMGIPNSFEGSSIPKIKIKFNIIFKYTDKPAAILYPHDLSEHISSRCTMYDNKTALTN